MKSLLVKVFLLLISLGAVASDKNKIVVNITDPTVKDGMEPVIFYGDDGLLSRSYEKYGQEVRGERTGNTYRFEIAYSKGSTSILLTYFDPKENRCRGIMRSMFVDPGDEVNLLVENLRLSPDKRNVFKFSGKNKLKFQLQYELDTLSTYGQKPGDIEAALKRIDQFKHQLNKSDFQRLRLNAYAFAAENLEHLRTFAEVKTASAIDGYPQHLKDIEKMPAEMLAESPLD